MGVKARPTVLMPLRNRAAFREHYFDKDGRGGVFVQGDVAVELGEEVDLEVHFLEEQVSLRIRGQARWRRAANSRRRNVLPGVGIEFLPEEAHARDLLLQFVDGKDLGLIIRSGRRFGVNVRIKVRQDGATLVDTTDDLSEGGAFILSEDPIPVGSRVELRLLPPGSLLGVGVKAVVAWRRDEGRRGFGVEFLFDSDRQRRRVARLVEDLKEQLLKELKIRSPRGS